jgi:queuine tRNA-ribosyltransferase
MLRTHTWAKRCIEAQTKKQQALFGIVQGGEWKDLRKQSANFISSLDFDGFGIGGSLGKSKKTMYEILDWTIPLLPEGKPRHLLGIGYLEDFEKSIKKGVDIFDCSQPTRLARHGIVFTEKGEIDMSSSALLKQKNPIDRTCRCFVCRDFSRAYLCHLFRAKEPTAIRFFTYHNLWFYKKYLDKIRQGIVSGKL